MNFEVPPRRLKQRSFPKSKILSPEKKAERMRQIKEGEENEQQENVRVTEKLLNDLEMIGVKCQLCGSKNIKEDVSASNSDAENTHLYCVDCNYKWTEAKK